MYLWVLVDSWQQKWRNPFCMCEDGLTVGSKSWLQYHIHVWFTYLISPVPCDTGGQIGNWAWVWYWSNKLCAITVSRTPMQNSSVYCPTLHFPPFLNRTTRDTLRHWTETASRGFNKGNDREKRGRRKDIGVEAGNSD